LWVLDVSALRQLKPDQLVSAPVLYQPNATMRWRSVPAHARTNRRFNGQNPTLGAQIYYSLPKSAEKVSLKILDIAGNTLRELPGGKNAGLNRITWDLRPIARSSAPTTQPNRMPTTRRSTTRPVGFAPRTTAERPSGESGGGPPQQRFGGLPPVPPGAYRLVLNVDGKEFSQTLKVDADPVVADSTMASNESELDENEEEEEEMEREQTREIRPLEID
jgi:hypothetical protein